MGFVGLCVYSVYGICRPLRGYRIHRASRILGFIGFGVCRVVWVTSCCFLFFFFWGGGGDVLTLNLYFPNSKPCVAGSRTRHPHPSKPSILWTLKPFRPSDMQQLQVVSHVFSPRRPPD